MVVGRFHSLVKRYKDLRKRITRRIWKEKRPRDSKKIFQDKRNSRRQQKTFRADKIKKVPPDEFQHKNGENRKKQTLTTNSGWLNNIGGIPNFSYQADDRNKRKDG